MDAAGVEEEEPGVLRCVPLLLPAEATAEVETGGVREPVWASGRMKDRMRG
jgi:hypothetical protein